MKKRILSIICCFAFILSFGLLCFGSSSNSSYAQTVSSDNEDWTSDNLSVLYGYCTSISDNVVVAIDGLFSLDKISEDSSRFSAYFYGSGVDGWNYTGPYNGLTGSGDNILTFNDSGILYKKQFKMFSHNFDTGEVVNVSNYTNEFCVLYIQNTDNNLIFNNDVVSVTFGGVGVTSRFPNGAYGENSRFSNTPFPQSLITGGDSFSYTSYNWVRYFDSLGNSLSIIIPFYPTNDGLSLPQVWHNHTYFTNKLTDNDYYDAGYNTGYAEGDSAGYSTGYTAGYDLGYNNGNTTGYNAGYNAGATAAGTYTFFGLVSSVIDAPIRAFRGLFNFDLLGVNLASLITGLFTLCVIVCIVKLVLGGK